MASTSVSNEVLFNGKFLAAEPTGVHRVAGEMILALDHLLQKSGLGDISRDYCIVEPLNAYVKLNLRRIKLRRAGRLRRQLWEQISLPLFARRRRLVNLCNLAPMIRPGVVMIHDAQVHISPGSYSKLFGLYYRLVQPIMAKRADRVLTVSAFSRDMLVKYHVATADKITVIHNGADHMLRLEADPGVLQRLDLQLGEYAVALANVQVHKNIGILLRAFSDPRLAAAKLVLVGSAPAEAFIAQGHAVPDNVVFAGRVSDEVYRALLEGAACMAFPSTTEGFGLPPLEAMILGCPAVVSPCGALPEVCGDAAIYAAPNDPDAWTGAIAAFTESWTFREKVGVVSRDWASAFTWERSARDLIDVLTSLYAE